MLYAVVELVLHSNNIPNAVLWWGCLALAGDRVCNAIISFGIIAAVSI